MMENNRSALTAPAPQVPKMHLPFCRRSPGRASAVGAGMPIGHGWSSILSSLHLLGSSKPQARVEKSQRFLPNYPPSSIRTATIKKRVILHGRSSFLLLSLPHYVGIKSNNRRNNFSVSQFVNMKTIRMNVYVFRFSGKDYCAFK